MPSIKENIRWIKQRMTSAAKKAGRAPDMVELVAVVKNVDSGAAISALEAGVASLGESRVQEARRKFESIGSAAKWHFIGPLQSNKIKYLPGLFDLVHSPDRPELFNEISRRANQKGVVMDCLLQINLSGEASKSGCKPEIAETIIKEASMLPGIRICGLMTVPPLSEDPEDSRPYFRELVEMARKIDGMGLENVTMDRISAGMTNDFEVAIEEGATIIRVGSAIFGPRE